MMEDLITDLRNMTGMGRFARAEVREILAYLESVGWLSEPSAPGVLHDRQGNVVTQEQMDAQMGYDPKPSPDRALFPAVDNLVEVAQSDV